MSKIIFLELNEVPFKVIDFFCKKKPNSVIAKILRSGTQYETYTEDEIQLDPWISWPTLHRGVPDTIHKIFHLGQNLNPVDPLYPPLWKILKSKGLKVGVFGSLHTSTLPENVDDYSFYLPDYFADEVFAHPQGLKSFQELNLTMTRQSARNVSRTVPLSAFAQFAMTAPAQGVTLSTVIDSISHLISEIVDRTKRIRRRAYQPIVMADLFLHQMKLTKPDFATFYTNHVAAAMHRYWGAAFPEDYGDQPLDSDWIQKYEKEILFAMEKFDLILNRFVKFVDKNPEYALIIASSMGQAAIPSQKTYEFLTINNLQQFMSGLGVPSNAWEAKPAMVPCICVAVDDAYRNIVLHKIKSLEIAGQRFVEDRRPIAPMSYDEREQGFFQFFVQFDNYDGSDSLQLNDKNTPLSQMGFGMMAHEDGVNCTAQHVREGSLIVYHPHTLVENMTNRERQRVSTLDFVPSVLANFGFTAAPYMNGKASIKIS
jgi:hypothetical protein